MRNLVVLTGGPGGGKTTLLREVRAMDPQGARWLAVPEAAPLVFASGLRGGSLLFQQTVVRMQMAMEESILLACGAQQAPICHRGTLDALAYWLRAGGTQAEFEEATSMTMAEHYARYTGVIHLETAAAGALAYYHSWPKAHRAESAEEAVEIDRLCERVWSGHPGYLWIGNSGKDWALKSAAALQALNLMHQT